MRIKDGLAGSDWVAASGVGRARAPMARHDRAASWTRFTKPRVTFSSHCGDARGTKSTAPSSSATKAKSSSVELGSAEIKIRDGACSIIWRVARAARNTGRPASIKMTSGFRRWASTIASSPLRATPTASATPDCLSARDRKCAWKGEPSAISTRIIWGGADSRQGRPPSQGRLKSRYSDSSGLDRPR